MKNFDLKNLFNKEGLEKFFVQTRSSAIGIDVGNSSVKIVQLSKKKEGIFLTNYALAKIKNSDPLKGKNRFRIVGRILKKIKQELNWDIDEANISVPLSSSLLTSVDFWATSNEEIDQLIQVEASKYIPIPLEEVIYGWKIVDTPPPAVKPEAVVKEDEKKAGEEKKKVVVVAVMKDVSRKYEEALSLGEVAVETLEVDVFSLARCLGREGKSSLILDFGENSSNLVAALGRSPVLAKNIDLGSGKITDLMAHLLGVDAARADKLKLEQGINITSMEIRDSIFALLENLKEEIVSMKESFNKDFPDSPVDELILVGGGAELKGLREHLEKETGIKIGQGAVFEEIILPEKIKGKLLLSSRFFSVAVGLALIDLKKGAG